MSDKTGVYAKPGWEAYHTWSEAMDEFTEAVINKKPEAEINRLMSKVQELRPAANREIEALIYSNCLDKALVELREERELLHNNKMPIKEEIARILNEYCGCVHPEGFFEDPDFLPSRR